MAKYGGSRVGWVVKGAAYKLSALWRGILSFKRKFTIACTTPSHPNNKHAPKSHHMKGQKYVGNRRTKLAEQVEHQSAEWRRPKWRKM